VQQVNRQLSTWLARTFLLAGVSTVVPSLAAAQSGCAQSNDAVRGEQPPGKDLYVPYVVTPSLTHEKELQNVEQVKMLAEINRLTVELVKRRSNRNALQADTPQLVKRLKDLAKKLRDAE
jgi:hypothetical protein